MSTPIGQTQQPTAVAAAAAMMDDDDTIREVLQTISATPSAPAGAPLMAGGVDGGMLLPPQVHAAQQRVEQSHPHYSASAYIPTLAADLPTQPRAAFVSNPTSTIDRYWDADAQKACYVAAIAAVVLALPVEQVVFQYVNIQHVPYSAVLVKAVCIAAAFYVVSKLR